MQSVNFVAAQVSFSQGCVVLARTLPFIITVGSMLGCSDVGIEGSGLLELALLANSIPS